VNRIWVARIIGIMLIGMLLFALLSLHSRLSELAKTRAVASEASE
jgi:hypothetical protein